jgi:hypothetical protein
VADVSGALAPADATPPALTLDDPPAVTADATPAFGGAAGNVLGDFPGVVATVRRGGDVVRRIAAQPLLGRWSAEVTPPLPDGAYTVEAEQGDAAGNATRTPARAFTVDTTAPPAPVATPQPTATPVSSPQPIATPRPCMLTLLLPRQRLSAVRRQGLSVALRASPACRVSLTVKLGRALLAQRTVAATTRSRHVTTALSRRALAHRRRVTLTVTASSPGARPVARRATLRA